MKKLVLCFGASLTEGFVGPGLRNRFEPYTNRLGELLGNSYEVLNYGLSGENSASMVIRLPLLLDCAVNFECVFILGGTNDLNIETDCSIANNLKKLHDLCALHGVRSFALSIPEVVGPNGLFQNVKRINVNKALEDYASVQTNMTFIDWASNLPNTWQVGGDQNDNWSDNLHLTGQGYNKMAEIIFKECNKKGFFL